MHPRDEHLAQRAALLARLRQNTPAAMRERPQWLLWKLINKRGAGKPAKVPFYASGQLRGWPHGKPTDGVATEEQPQVEQGHELDRAALVSFEEALAAFERAPSWAGVGYAFLPGDGLIGVDIDGAVDAETGEISRRCEIVMAMCPSYTERSVSGTGVHIILAGDTDKFKSDEIGLEVYCRSQYFTCTGDHWSGTPAEVLPMGDEPLMILRGMVEQALAKARAEREAAAALKHAAAEGQAAKARPAAPQRQGVSPAAGSSGPGQDFKRVNEAAMAQLAAWVPVLFPHAKPHTTEHGPGYRVSSKALGRQLQEDLAITPGGIRDFGEEQGKSPIDLVVQWGAKTPHEALVWLAGLVGVQLTKRRPPAGPGPSARPAARRPEPPDDDGGGGDDGGEGGHGPRESAPHPPEENEPAAHAGGGGGGGPVDDERPQEGPPDDDGEANEAKAPRKLSKHEAANLKRLHSTFAYQYGSKVAWDCALLKPIEITNLRHSYGNEPVKRWMNSAERRVVQEEQVMFEPGRDLGPACINLFAGLPLEPEEGDCEVMLELLRHLCSTSEAPGLGPEAIVTWVLRWCALPLQRLGAKLDTALVFHGPQGTGKNLFFDVIRDMYGAYGVMVGQTEIEDKYNTWLSRKMLIVGDEVVSRQEMYHAKNRLKWIVTQKEKIPIRAMHMDTRWESNHANLVFLSNESQPLALEDNDRRFLVVFTPAAEDGTLYARVREFLEAGGAAKLLHYLMRLDLGEFNEHTKPPVTTAKLNLIELGYKPAERFMHELLLGYLPLPVCVCSVEQLYKAFRRWCDSTGERFWPTQAIFSAQAGRFAAEKIERDKDGVRLLPMLKTKVIQLKADPSVRGARKAVRCWVPRGCGPGEEFDTEGEWAESAIKDFDVVLRGYLRRHGLGDGTGDDAGDGRPEPPDGV